MTETIKPCPNCGRIPSIKDIASFKSGKDTWYRVNCTVACATGPARLSIEEAFWAWNNRPIEKALVAVLGEVSGYLMAQVHFTGKGQSMLDVVDKALAMAEGREIE